MRLVCYTPEQCVYPVNWAAADDRQRERSVRYFERSLEIAAELGSTMMLVSSGWGFRTEPAGEAWKRSRDSLERVATRASDLGIDLVLEPFQPVESNLVIGLATLGRMLAEIDSPRVGACLESTVSMAVAAATASTSTSLLSARLCPTSTSMTGTLPAISRWGDGALPLSEYVEQLARHEYRGYLTLEIADERYRLDPDECDQARPGGREPGADARVSRCAACSA